MEEFDIVVVGGGIAGLTAGIYAVRGGWKTLLLEETMVGGQLALIDRIENFPGFTAIAGLDLSKRIEAQAKTFGLKIEFDSVKKIEDKGNSKIVIAKNNSYEAKAVIVATGAGPKFLEVPGEMDFARRGVHYCALCDGPLYKDKKVFVIGGGDSAMIEAVFLANIASTLTIVHRRASFKAEKANQDKIFSNKKVSIIWNSVVEEFIGDSRLRKIKLKNIATGEISIVEADAVFIYIGLKPKADFVEVKKQGNGLIEVTCSMETSVPGIFAAGNCTNKGIQQLSTCVGQGATAAVKAGEYIDNILHKNSSNSSFVK